MLYIPIGQRGQQELAAAFLIMHTLDSSDRPARYKTGRFNHSRQISILSGRVPIGSAPRDTICATAVNEPIQSAARAGRGSGRIAVV